MAEGGQGLRLERITKRYRTGTLALDDVSLRIGRGVLALLGPNGAGKTTLMRVVTTLQAPSNGGVYWDDVDVLRWPNVLRRELGYLPQDFGAPPGFTGREVLRRLAAMRGLAGALRRERVEEALERVDLGQVADRPTGTYSGGMRRRLGIAQAIVHRPRLIVVDEPTAGLDPEERVRFRSLIADLARDHAILLSTHIVGDVEISATRVAVLQCGRLIAEDAQADFIRRAAGHIWTTTVSDADYERLRASDPQRVISATRRADSVLVRLRTRDASGPPLEGADPAEPTLEDAYLYCINADEQKERAS